MIKEYQGVILAGGNGSRLFPSTLNTSKHLLSIYDKPLIYYSLSTLMLAGVRDIIIVVNKNHLDAYKKLLGNGSKFGIKIKYKIQDFPEGIPHALKICRSKKENLNYILTLGDNILYGSDLSNLLQNSLINSTGSTIFTYSVPNPKRYGVLSKSKNGMKIIEKPKNPMSDQAVIGLYLFDNHVFDYIGQLKKSKRGEYEIADLINIYIKNKSINVLKLNRGFTWIDAGTHDSMLLASNHIQNIEKIQSLKISCIEEISLRNNWININDFKKLINTYPESDYKNYLKKIAKL